MIGLLVTGHGHFATGLGSSLELIAGKKENVALVDFEADHSTETLKANLLNAFESLKQYDGVLVLSDLPGGSPFKTAVECSYELQGTKIEVLAGTNLPLLLASALMSGFAEDPLTLANQVMSEGKDGIVRFELQERSEETEEDGI